MTNITVGVMAGTERRGSPVLRLLAAEITNTFPTLRCQVGDCTWQSKFKPKGLRYFTRVGPMRHGYGLYVYEDGRQIAWWNTADPSVSVRRDVRSWIDRRKRGTY